MSNLSRIALAMALCLTTASCAPAPTAAPAQAPVDRSAPGQTADRSEPGDTPAEREVAAGTSSQQDLLAFGRRIGVQCRARAEQVECSGGKPENGEIYDVELMPSCGPDGFFGGVAEEAGAELRDALAPNDEHTVAVLKRGQIVCIQAVARAGQQPAYYYATTIPTSAIGACKGNRLCEMYGDRGVQLTARAVACPTPPHRLECAAGWIDADRVEAFENGM